MGEVVVSFTQLEDAVSIYFSLLLGCEPELASIIANSLPMKERCDALHHIIAYRLGSADMIRAGINTKRNRKLQIASDIFKRLDEAAQIRNKVLHSSWSSSSDPQSAHRLKWSKKRDQAGFPIADYSLLTADDISKQSSLIDAAEKALEEFIWGTFNKWITDRAVNKEDGLQII
jgi:hypothetical protein